MSTEIDTMDGTDLDQIKIALNTLYLCLEHALKHISESEGLEAAAAFKAKLVESLKTGDINFALLEETTTFDLIVSKVEALGNPKI